MGAEEPNINFARELASLMRPEAFSYFAVPEMVSVRHTHASAVILTDDLAYKLKKPNNFGFFDYSTPALRRHFCSEEVRLNARLAPQVYLGVSPVLMDRDGEMRFGPVLQPADLPDPWASIDGAMVVDFAVIMRRLADEATLDYLVAHGLATDKVMREVAGRIAQFHRTIPTNRHIASFGGLDVIRANWEENFAQMAPYIGRSLEQTSFDTIYAYVNGFMETRAPLFASRVREGNIRDCHGDLRLQHVYVLHEDLMRPDAVAIIDCIEFNERFRYSDVAAEVTFLTMELELAGRADLAHAFLQSYVEITHDDALMELVPFYTCYRACVRGKVLSFQLDEHEVPEEQRDDARNLAARHFELAERYAHGPYRPQLVLIGGVMGTGKSTIATNLRHSTGAVLISSDITRKRLAGIPDNTPRAEAFGVGLYSPAWTDRTYEATFARADQALRDGRSVIIDASFGRAAHRQRAAEVGARAGADTTFVECLCSRETAIQRLTERWHARRDSSASSASLASDGRPELYDEQIRRWEPVSPDEEIHLRHFQLDTQAPLTVTLERALNVLGIPHSFCMLSD